MNFVCTSTPICGLKTKYSISHKWGKWQVKSTAKQKRLIAVLIVNSYSEQNRVLTVPVCLWASFLARSLMSNLMR